MLITHYFKVDTSIKNAIRLTFQIQDNYPELDNQKRENSNDNVTNEISETKGLSVFDVYLFATIVVILFVFSCRRKKRCVSQQCCQIKWKF